MRLDPAPTSGAPADDRIGRVTVESPADGPYRAIVGLVGEHDLATAPDIAEAFARIDGNVLVELSTCEFIDSTVIGVILERARELKQSNAFLEIVIPPENTLVTRTFEIIGMRDLVRMHDAFPRRAGTDPADDDELRPRER